MFCACDEPEKPPEEKIPRKEAEEEDFWAEDDGEKVAGFQVDPDIVALEEEAAPEVAPAHNHSCNGRTMSGCPVQWENGKMSAWLLAFFAIYAGALAPVFNESRISGIIAWDRGSDCMADYLNPATRTSFASAVVDKSWHYTLIVSVITVAMVANIWIVYHHWTTPPHPKFMLLPIRWFGIRLHLVSGTTEIVTGMVCWFLADSAVCTRAMAVASMAHCFSGFLLTPIVFGSKAVTTPGYIFCIVFKAIQAVNVYLNPDCYLRVLGLIATHTIYAWFRIAWIVFEVFQLIPEYSYTLALLSSGCLVFSLLGTWIVIVFFAALIVYNIALGLVWGKAEVAMRRKEAPRTFKIEQIGCPFLKSSQESNTQNFLKLHEGKILAKIDLDKIASESEQAKVIFDAIDANENGSISFKELSWTLSTTGVPFSDAVLIMSKIDKDKSSSLNFEEFQTSMRPLWLWAYNDLRRLKVARVKESQTDATLSNWFSAENAKYDASRDAQRSDVAK